MQESETLDLRNIDRGDLDHFDNLSNEWWDRDGVFKTLHQINPLRTEFIKKLVVSKLGGFANREVLDVGCGGGILTESLAFFKPKSVSGIDMSSKSLVMARLHALESDLEINYQQDTVEDFSTRNLNRFDIITCMEMLEHVPDPSGVIKTCSHMLKPNGLLFVSTINRNLKAFVLAIVVAEYLVGMLPRGTHSYSKFIKPSEMHRMMRGSGLCHVQSRGIAFHPVSGHFVIIRDTSVNYMSCFIKSEF